MILPKLASGISQRPKSSCDRGRLRRYSNVRTSLAYRRHTGPDWQFTGDERRAARRTTRLGVVVGEKHAFSCKLVEVWGPAGHYSTVISADVEPADIVAHYEYDIGVWSCCCQISLSNR